VACALDHDEFDELGVRRSEVLGHHQRNRGVDVGPPAVNVDRPRARYSWAGWDIPGGIQVAERAGLRIVDVLVAGVAGVGRVHPGIEVDVG
jgi:hypothetical protein